MGDTFSDFNGHNWENIKKDLKKDIGDAAYNNWLKKLGFLDYVLINWTDIDAQIYSLENFCINL